MGICPKHTKEENEKMVKITLTFEMEEEQLRELFESMRLNSLRKKQKNYKRN